MGMNPKDRILTLLRSAAEPISGESIGRQLGISRVAVHKHIKGLKSEGYSLEADYRGYSLKTDGNLPFTDREFPAVQHVRILKETGSTMDEAHRLVEKHPDEDFVLAAEKQTGGRGRRGRPWSSPEGGLWVTRVIHPGGSSMKLQLHVMAATAALAGVLRHRYGIPAELKWPNDVLVEGRKIAGVLGEAEVSGDRIRHLALGLGLNVNNQILPGTAGIKELLGQNEDRRELLEKWITATDTLLASRDFDNGRKPEWWNRLMAGIGDKAVFISSGRKVKGRIIGADSLGRLVLKKEKGRKIHLAPGDIDDSPEEEEDR